MSQDTDKLTEVHVVVLALLQVSQKLDEREREELYVLSKALEGRKNSYVYFLEHRMEIRIETEGERDR